MSATAVLTILFAKAIATIFLPHRSIIGFNHRSVLSLLLEFKVLLRTP
ncbi:hypothetical protein VCHA36P166_130035 [Vibrio chagasii]|nr:hypothetical protein VCHA36P166_130035 [Vibrio chagasii]